MEENNHPVKSNQGIQYYSGLLYDNQNFLSWSHSSGRNADQVNCWICHRGEHDKMVTDMKKEKKDFTDLF